MSEVIHSILGVLYVIMGVGVKIIFDDATNHKHNSWALLMAWPVFLAFVCIFTDRILNDK